MVMRDEIAAAVADEFPDVTSDKMLVDDHAHGTAAGDARHHRRQQPACRYPLRPGGGAGGLARHRADPERRFPSMFEPIHGSAFDIAGQGIANPIGTFWSGVMMLEHLGEGAAAARLMRAIERVTADPALHTPDLGGKATTRRVTAAVVAAIAGDNA